jgi:hypothetical protein
MVRDFRATTTASALGRRAAPCGTPMVCTVRMPARTSMLARSVAPVKSSAMQPSMVSASFAGSSMPAERREDLDHRAVVLCAVAGRLVARYIWCAVAASGSGNLSCACGVQHDAQVLDEDVDRRQRRVVAGQDVRHAVLEHPAVAGELVITSYSCAGSAPARMPRAMASQAAAMCTPASSWLTIFTVAAGAGAVAQAVDLAGHGIQQPACGGKGLGPARGHHRHLAVGGLGGAAGQSARRHQMQALAVQALLQRGRPVRVDGGAHHEPRCRDSFRCAPLQH